jgi:hypothetical protein
MKKTALIIGLLLVCNIAFAQNLTFYGLLPAFNQTGRISKKLNYNLFVSTTIDAFDENVNGVEYPATDLQFYLQPSIIYVHSPNLNFAGSYTYQRNNPFNGNFVNEHRLWQQVIFSLPISSGRLTNRFRFEERFIENKVTEEYPFSTRARYQIGFNIPLQGWTLDKHEFYFNTYNEFYFSLTGAKNATYSENWTYAGCGYDLGKMGRLELGYLFQIAVRNAQQDLRFLNLAQVMWITNFNFPKKKKDDTPTK